MLDSAHAVVAGNNSAGLETQTTLVPICFSAGRPALGDED